MNWLKQLIFAFAYSAAVQVILLDKSVDAFIGTNQNNLHNHAYHHRKSSTSSRNMVFERMSENCIGAIVSAQKQAQKFSQTQVEVPFLVAGIVDMPESSAMERTFKQYGVTWRKTLQNGGILQIWRSKVLELLRQTPS